MRHYDDPRPVIGIPCSIYPDSWYPPGHGVNVSYLRAIEAAGGLPFLLYLTDDASVLVANYRRCDALLFAGGVDVTPSFYGEKPHPQLGETSPKQDAVEIDLARRAAADGLPILGICRGMQLLNVAMGGTLYQDIPSEVPEALNHRASEDHHQMAYLSHDLRLDPSSWLSSCLQAVDLPVNTVHHQALRNVAPLLQVTGRAPDGIVEAVEGLGSGFLLGVQCHPEELWSTDSRWATMFSRFVAMAREQR